MKTINILLVETDSDWLNILKTEIVKALTNIGFSNKDINFISVDILEKAFDLINDKSFELVIINILIGKILVKKAYDAKIPTIVFIPENLGYNHYRNLNDIRDFFVKYQVHDIIINIKEEFELDKFIDSIQKIFKNKQEKPHPSNQLSEEDRKYLIDKLAALAATSTMNSVQYFEKLVNSLDLPQHWKNELTGFATGDSNYDAQKLIGWCEIRYYPSSSNKSGKKVLVYLIKELLNDCGDDDKLREIIWKYELI